MSLYFDFHSIILEARDKNVLEVDQPWYLDAKSNLLEILEKFKSLRRGDRNLLQALQSS